MGHIKFIKDANLDVDRKSVGLLDLVLNMYCLMFLPCHLISLSMKKLISKVLVSPVRVTY